MSQQTLIRILLACLGVGFVTLGYAVMCIRLQLNELMDEVRSWRAGR